MAKPDFSMCWQCMHAHLSMQIGGHLEGAAEGVLPLLVLQLQLLLVLLGGHHDARRAQHNIRV